MPLSAHTSSFRFFMFRTKRDPQLQRVLSNEQLGPLVPRVPMPQVANLQRRVTGEMRRCHSDHDVRPLSDTRTTKESSLGGFPMPAQDADFVTSFQENVHVTTRCEPVVTLSTTRKAKDTAAPIATTNILPVDLTDDADSDSDDGRVFEICNISY